MYKSMRIFIDMLETNKWPSVGPNVMNEWKNNGSVIISEKKKIRTFLKANSYTPAWTSMELQLFEKCLNEIGFKKIGKYPNL